MLRNLKWEEGAVLSIQVEEGLFTLAQMRVNHLLEVFDVFRSDEDWSGVDLSSSEIIFCIFVSTKNIKGIFSSRVGDAVVPNSRPVKKRMLSAIFGAPGSMGANFIDLSEGYSNIGADLIKASLTLENDLDIIYNHELCGMVGNPERILKRLKVYHETGVNWDESKIFLFPDIKPPQPSR